MHTAGGFPHVIHSRVSHFAAAYCLLQEDRERRVLVFHCKSCDYTEDADPSDWCVYRNEVHHTSKERTVILQVRPVRECAYKQNGPWHSRRHHQFPGQAAHMAAIVDQKQLQ